MRVNLARFDSEDHACAEAEDEGRRAVRLKPGDDIGIKAGGYLNDSSTCPQGLKPESVDDTLAAVPYRVDDG